MRGRPPRVARALLRALVPADEREAVLRDLDEEFARHVRPSCGAREASAWYWRQVLGSFRPAFAMRRRRASGGLDRLGRDVALAIRALRRRPAIGAAAMLTMALGIGATTAVFSVVDAVVLRPLPYREPDRLVRIWSANPRGIPRNSMSPPDFFDIQEQATRPAAFVSLSAYSQGDSATLQVKEPVRVIASMVSHNLFETLGVLPARGRGFGAADAADGAARVAVVSFAFAIRTAVGTGAQVILDDDPVTVVGIMPEGFDFPSPVVDLWVPMRESVRRRSRSAHYLDVIGRLDDAASIQGATEVLSTIAARLDSAYPGTNRGWGVTVLPLHESVTGEVRRPLLILFAAVGCVLLIACANVAGLLLASGQERAREFSLRAAIGASPRRLITQQLVESLLLAVGGATGALAVAWMSVRGLQRLDGFSLPRAETISLDLRVLLATGAIAVAAGIVAGLVPALRAARTDPELALKGARAAGPGLSARRLRRTLVIAQIAATLCLSTTALLLVRSLARVLAVDAGFDARNVILAQVAIAGAQYEPDRWSSHVERGLEELRGLPGVVAAGAGAPLPLAGQQGLLRFGVRVDGRPAAADGSAERTYVRWATPGYFEAMSIPLLEGRAFEARDAANARPVAVVDQTFVDRYLNARPPVGVSLQLTNERVPRQIVGVVGFVRQTSLEAASDPHVYVPHAQNPSPSMTFVIRTAADPRAFTATVRERLRRVDPTRPVYNVRTAADLVSRTVAPRRLTALLISIFAALAGGLSLVGMYGLMAGWVTESRKELGVRLALGAERGAVMRLVIRRALAITAAGIAIGLPLALVSGGAVRSMLFGVPATDAPSMMWGATLLLVLGLTGAYLPARRAVAVNPVESLRAE